MVGGCGLNRGEGGGGDGGGGRRHEEDRKLREAEVDGAAGTPAREKGGGANRGGVGNLVDNLGGGEEARARRNQGGTAAAEANSGEMSLLRWARRDEEGLGSCGRA